MILNYKLLILELILVSIWKWILNLVDKEKYELDNLINLKYNSIKNGCMNYSILFLNF